MADRKRLVITLALRSSLALLALVLVANLALPVLDAMSSGAAHPGTILTLPPASLVACFTTAMPTDSPPKVKALPSENEEEEGADALHERQGSFLSPSCFRKVSERQLIAPRSVLSLYPLRC